MINKGLFTSKTSEWETPQWLFDELNKEFHFELDVCATKENTKCDNFYTKEIDGLRFGWGGASLVQSSLWKRNWKVGSARISYVPQRNNSDASSGQNRYKMVSLLSL